MIKAIYLLDCEWYKIFGTTYTGLRYLRDNNGPFNTDFYAAKNDLCNDGYLMETEYFHPGGKGYEFSLGENLATGFELDPMARYIAESIVEELKYADLNSFLDKAYSTPPMILVQEIENGNGHKLYGEELKMDELRKSPKPLFSLDEVKRAAKHINFEIRGTDEEYAKVVNEEIEELRIYRERAAEAWKLVQ